MAIQGKIPAMQPKMKAVQSVLPGCSYFSTSQPNRIIEALTPKIAVSAAMSRIPTSDAMSTTMSDELNAYSTQRK